MTGNLSRRRGRCSDGRAPAAGPWQNFYVAICGASAAMLSLLFVGLSLHLRIVISRPAIRALARQTYTNFVGISIIALMMLMPTTTLLPQSVVIGLWASSNLFMSVQRLWLGFQHPLPGITGMHLLQRFGGTAMAHLGLLVVVALFVRGEFQALFALVFVMIWLLLACVRNAWDLLISVADLGVVHLETDSQRRSA